MRAAVRSFSRRRRGAAGLAWRGSAAAGGLRGRSVSRVEEEEAEEEEAEEEEEEEAEAVARRGKKRRLKREESGRRKRAPKHSVSRPERKSRNRNFCGSRSPSAAGQPGIPGSFRSTTMGHRIAAAGRAPPSPPGSTAWLLRRKAQGCSPPRSTGWSGRLQRGPPAGDTWMAPERAEPRGPAAARGPRPSGSQGAERWFSVPPSGMKAAASASRRSRAAERQGWGWAAPGDGPPGRLPRCCRAGSGSGAEEVRSLLSRRWAHAAAFLRGGGR
ncbi:hypothetical protein llap_13922 [Limosa lapponica baueri]|uniref:Uncharacterized protein n=1 Tax=Limosa lapponica baueri TaxID=1758121 RepID=A0A2I0TPS6_LIMLA|nr:hypothetical protein llap_13922 [Limosa lapponica baueri]